MAGSRDNVSCTNTSYSPGISIIDFPPTKYYVRNGLRLSENIGQTSSHQSIRLFAQCTLNRPVSHRSHPSCPPVVQEDVL